MQTSGSGAASCRTGTSVCPYCGTGCCILFHGSSAFPPAHHRVTQGALCLRGWSAAELFWSPLRLTAATLRAREDGATSVLPVESALEHAAARLRDIRDREGGASIGVLGSARVTVEECRELVRLAQALGTPHVDSMQRLGYVPGPSLGLDALEAADRVLVLAANLTVRQAQAGRRVLRAMGRGARVRFVHSRRVQLAALATAAIHTLPGHELEALGGPDGDEILLTTTECALSGQGGPLLRALRERRAVLLADYVNQRGMVEAGIHPRPDGLSAWEMLQKAAAGGLRALVVCADDPFEFFPALAAEAFARVELTVVLDAVRTPTARWADVVLPGALLAEKNGHVVSFEGRAQEVAAVGAPPGGWTEGRLLERLTGLLGGPLDETPFHAPQVPGPDLPPADRPSEAYPFIAALDTTSFWSTHALTASTVTAWREARNVFADFPPGYATLNPEDARALRLQFGSDAKLTSATGSVTLPARLHPRMMPGTVWIPMHAWERVGTRLGALEFDPGLRIPVFRPRAVRVSRP